MKNKFIILFTFVFMFGILGVASAEVNTDYETMFKNMELEDLLSVSETLSQVINEKRLENASLQIDSAGGSVAVGQTLPITLLPEGREITETSQISYTSSDESIATIQNGIVTGVNNGTANIIATVVFEDEAVLEASAAIEVFTPIKTITAPATYSSLVNKEINLKDIITLTPSDASYDHLIYSVDDTSVATVNESGILKGLKGGSVVVTITTNENPGAKSAKVKISVDEPVTSITLDNTEFNLGKGKTITLVATVGPESASNKTLTWSSDDSSIATVSKQGVVTGKKSGTAIITCTANDGSGISASSKITVITAVSSIKFDKKSFDIFEKQSGILSLTVLPADATNPEIKWESSNTSVVTIDDNGTVIGKKSGKATITAFSTDGSNKSASISINVEPQVPAIPSSLFWQTTWGQKNGKMGIEVENLCTTKKITYVKYRIRCQSAYTMELSEDSDACSVNVSPGQKKKGKLSRDTISGFTRAAKVEITITSVTFSDGTVYDIPEDVQESYTFTI